MFQSLLQTIASGLDQRAIPYMVVGGQAVLLYGEPRHTKDIDVTLGVGPERLQDLVDLAEASGWTVLPESPKEFVLQTMVLPCIDDPSGIRLDFIFSLSPYEQEALGRARAILVGSRQVRFASVEDLIIHKIVAGRPRDLEDMRGVLLKNPGADLGYVRGWLEQFQEALDEPLLKRLEDVIVALE